MSKNEKRVTIGDELSTVIDNLEVTVTFKSGKDGNNEDAYYTETFVFDGITRRELAEYASRKCVIARGNSINKIKTPEEVAEFAAEGTHRVNYGDCSKEILTKAKKHAAIREYMRGLSAEERDAVRRGEF